MEPWREKLGLQIQRGDLGELATICSMTYIEGEVATKTKQK